MLRGSGLEVGALHNPCPIPPGVRVVYVDAIAIEGIGGFFPESDPGLFARPDHFSEKNRGPYFGLWERRGQIGSTHSSAHMRYPQHP